MVTSNDDVLDKNDQFLEEASMFVIINGIYKVSTAMYNMKNSKEELETNYPVNSEGPKKPKSKILLQGDIFGEVSLLFGCKRTATVKAKMYSQCAQLRSKEFSQIISKYNWFKQYMARNIMQHYDDELKIFLMSCLKKVDYLSDPKIEPPAI